MEMQTNYFTCTLDQAVNHQNGKFYRTIAEFIDFKARDAPQIPVLGLYEVPRKPSHEWTSHVLTFKEVQKGIGLTARALLNTFDAQQGQTVALLCPSSPGLLFTWLGLVWLGHPVLLVAPQCSPSAIAQLCESCAVEVILFEQPHGDLASKASHEASQMGERSLSTHPVPFAGEGIVQAIKNTGSVSLVPPANVREYDVAYLHHTSGTSGGVPKPIPQTHRAAVGVLPILEGARHASFTTTPLYHGGVADLFRAWTSNAMIWLFPGKDLPMTATNVCKCLDGASASGTAGVMTPEIRYFSSVPYVLQMLADDKNGRQRLQGMDIVGVGGAALPSEVGDGLVKDGINLISRFGSAECGFIMSSHRDFVRDKEWQYLRASTPGRDLFVFEPVDDGLSELIIRPGWPHMAKHNRDDGSFATADLFTPHPTILGAWRYHSRADSQLTLITGKKFDPAPLEDDIRASAASVIEDILIFGNGRPYPGALLFPRDTVQVSGQDLISQIASVVERLNRKSQSHARISKSMLVAMHHLDRRLEKSSKGTILRTKAEERFAEKIAAAYTDQEVSNGAGFPPEIEISEDEIPARIRDIVEAVVGEGSSGYENSHEALTEHTDLFAYGVDSVACMQIRRALSKLLPKGSALPLTVVQDTGTIAKLSGLVVRARSGQESRETKGQETDEQNQHQLMLDLVDEYGVFDPPQSQPLSSPASLPIEPGIHCPPNQCPGGKRGIHVLLTGPTGSLGAHILHQLLSSPSVFKIHLLVRGTTPTASRERVLKALTSRRLPVPASFDTKAQIHNCRLSDPKLGLSDEGYQQLAEAVDVMVHLAWSVNFLLPLRAFAQTHLAGTRNLINLALSPSRGRDRLSPRFIFCSSVAAVSAYPATTSHLPTTIPEAVLQDPAVAGPTGYAQSKWVAEQICQRAVRQCHRLRNRISIARVGQLSGARDTGVWSSSEAYPLMLSSVKVTRCLPDLDGARRAQGEGEGEILAWMPVNLAARAFVEDILNHNDHPSLCQAQNNVKNVAAITEADGNSTGEGQDGLAVHHILNPSTRITWSDLLAWLSRRRAFETVPIHEWLSRLSSLQDRDDDVEMRSHPALRLLGFWEKAYGAPRNASKATDAGATTAGQEEPRSHGRHDRTKSEWNNEVTLQNGDGVVRAPAVRYEMAKTYQHMPCLRGSEGLMDEEYASRLLTWITDNV